MKLAQLLKVDTTKENWFKLLNKKGINPKTVNVVSKGGGEGSSIEYIDVRSLDDVTKFILVSGALAFNGSMTMGDKVIKMVSPLGNFAIAGVTIDLQELKFIAIDFGFKMVTSDKTQSIKDALIEQYNYTEDQLAAIPRITKEEFYNLQ